MLFLFCAVHSGLLKAGMMACHFPFRQTLWKHWSACSIMQSRAAIWAISCRRRRCLVFLCDANNLPPIDISVLSADVDFKWGHECRMCLLNACADIYIEPKCPLLYTMHVHWTASPISNPEKTSQRKKRFLGHGGTACRPPDLHQPLPLSPQAQSSLHKCRETNK